MERRAIITYLTPSIIQPASDILQNDIDVKNVDKATNLVRMLGGFTNTMTPGHPKPLIKVAFRDHMTDDDPGRSLIDPEQFFTPTEFMNADHRICGDFDEYGQFKGKVTIYRKIFENHVISWKNGNGLPTRCGPFHIEFAVVNGMQRETLLPLQDWSETVAKMDAYGGLYIYRDGIRILPYGNTDYDWLDIEKNRSKSAKYYFFSFRRMFGVISLDSTNNSSLTEKAGREGFRENEAFRQFRDILKNFFVQLASDFFRDESSDTYYAERRDELQREDLLRKERKKQVSAKRVKLAAELEDFFIACDKAVPAVEIENILSEVEVNLGSRNFEKNSILASERYLQIEDNARGRIDRLEDKYRITRPRGVGFPKRLEKDWTSYIEAFGALKSSVFEPARKRLSELVGRYAEQARVSLDRRIQLKRTLDSLSRETTKTTAKEKKSTTEMADKVLGTVVEEAKASAKRVANAVSQVAADFARMDISEMNDEDLAKMRSSFEQRLIETRQKECGQMQSIRAQLEAMDVKGGGLVDQMEAVEQRAMVLEEQADIDLQLTQLGMAIEVINHEFNASILGSVCIAFLVI